MCSVVFAPQAAQSLPLPIVQLAKTVYCARDPLPVFIGKPVPGIIGDPARAWQAWRYLAREPAPGPASRSENSKCVYQEAFRDLVRALRDFIASKKGQRKGKRLGFPRFKKRGRCRDSFRFSTGAIGCTGTTVALPRLGVIRTHKSTCKLARRLGAWTARILSATVSRTAGRWFVSFTVEVERAIPERHARPGSAIGAPTGVGRACP